LKQKSRPTEHESYLKARQKLSRAVEAADREWWNPTLKRNLQEARQALARAQCRLEAEEGQKAMTLTETEADHAPDAFRT
jgi:hypothetical protein